MTEATSRRVLDSLDALLGRLDDYVFQVFDEDDTITNAVAVAPRLSTAIDEAVELLRDAEDAYASKLDEDDEPSVDSLDDIGRLISSQVAGQEITDILFMARGELHEARRGLDAARRRKNPIGITSGCDYALRALRRVLVSVESAVAEFEGIEIDDRRFFDMEIALDTRKVYAELQRRTRVPETTRLPALEERLRGILDQLQAIRSLDFYPLLRFNDRTAMTELRERIEGWLERPEVESGVRLWQDVIGFAELLSEINNRQELREHDREAVLRALHLLRDSGDARERPGPVLAKLEDLVGLDSELDAHLAAGRIDEPDALGRVLADLERRLAPAAPGGDPGALWPTPS